MRGARLLFGRYAEPQGYYLLDAETGEELPWPPFPEEQAAGTPGASLRPSPTGERILYTLWNGMAPPGGLGIGSVWSMNPDGSDKRQLAASDERTYPANAIWSPDGREIAYLRVAAPTAQAVTHEQPVELWVMNADGSGQRMLARLPYADGRQETLRWLLDDHIYLVTLGADLLRVSPRTGAVTRLAEGVEPCSFVISPGTQWIVVQNPAMGEARITSMGRRPLHLPSDLTWDPVGERAAYIRGPEAGAAEGIWSRALASGEERLLAHIRTSELRRSGMAWSPDGKMLAYETVEGIHLLDVDSGAVTLAVRDPFAGMENPPYQRGVEFVTWVAVPADGGR